MRLTETEKTIGGCHLQGDHRRRENAEFKTKLAGRPTITQLFSAS